MTRFHKAGYRVVDLETTGLEPETCGICEIAYVDTDTLSPFGEDEKITNPGIPIPPEASAIHHLTDQDVSGGLSPRDVWSLYCNPERVFVAHNAAFEQSFLEPVHGGGFGNLTWLCTQRLAMHLIPGLQSYSNQYLRYYLKLEVPEAHGMAAHRALADCYVTAALLRYLLSLDHGCETVDELVALAESPVELQTVTFGKHRGQAWDDVPGDYLLWMKRNGGWDRDTEHTIRCQLAKR